MAPSDVWAFGRSLISPGEPDLGVTWKILRYDGESWSEAPGLTAHQKPGQPSAAVVVPGSGEVAVVGTVGSRPAVVRSC